MAFWSKQITSGIDSVVDNAEIVALYKRWMHAAASGQIADAGTFLARKNGSWRIAPGEGTAPSCMLLQSLNAEHSDFEYLHYGANVVRHAGFDMTGRRVSEFGGVLSAYFVSCYQSSFAQAQPLYTMHYAERAPSVLTWERLILPLRAPDGDLLALVYNQPIESRHVLLETVLNAASDAILALRAVRNAGGEVVNWIVVVANDPARNLLGINGQANGEWVADVVPNWAQLGLHEHALQGVGVAAGLAFSLSFSAPVGMRQGIVEHSVIHCEGQTSSMGTDGCVLRLTNVSDRKMFESLLWDAKMRAEETTQSKSVFLATMSHEIRTPMNGVIGMTSLLLDSPLSSEQRSYCETIRESGEGLLVVINDILDFSKIESGQVALEYSDFGLRDCAQSALDLLAPLGKQKHLHLLCDIAPDLPMHIVGDMQRLRQVLVNLLGNAVKFSNLGQVLLRVVPVTNEQGQLLIRWSVHDSGPGIAAEALASLFQAFVQIKGSGQRRTPGTGLGLAICKRLVEVMGGQIGVTSQVGVGSEFFFTLPLQAAAEQPEGDACFLQNTRVAVLASTSDARAVYAAPLRQLGARVQLLSTPNEAIELARSANKPHALVVCDEIDEHLALKVAQATFARGAGIPVLRVSPQALRDDADAPLFAALLSTPLSPELLGRSVATALGMARPKPARKKSSKTEFDPTLAERYPLRILAVDDHDINRRVAVSMLASFGYRCDAVASGLDALTAVARQRYDLVLMDVQMADMDGLEATRRIVRSSSAYACPHIVGMSANAMAEDRQAALDSGMVDYLTKPITVPALRAVLSGAARAKFGAASGSGGDKLGPGVGGHPHQSTVGAPPTSGLDASQLDALIALDDDGSFFAELLASFEQNLPQTIAAMAQAALKRDADALARLAHQVKGVAANLGASELSLAAERVNLLAASGEFSYADDAIEQVQRCFERAVQKIKNHRR